MDVPTRTQADYSQMQRAFYNERAQTLDDAKELVHLDFERAQRQAAATHAQMLLDFVQRTHPLARSTHDVPALFQSATAMPEGFRALDFGCGVGRLMEPLAQAGIAVDGVDISERMLGFAQANPALKTSRFYLGSGADCGEAPGEAYDLIYSHLCIQHICSRTVRQNLLRSFRALLRPGGVVFIQFHYYPEHMAGTVPLPHVPWSADHFSAEGTNSEADVWATPDELPLIYEDFSRHFDDLRLQFLTFPKGTVLFTDAYRAWFGHLVVSGSVGPRLAKRFYQS